MAVLILFLPLPQSSAALIDRSACCPSYASPGYPKVNSPSELPLSEARAAASARRTIDTLDWSPRFGRLPGKFYTRLQPTALPDPYLIAHNPDALGLIGVDANAVAERRFTETLSGGRVPPGSAPLARTCPVNPSVPFAACVSTRSGSASFDPPAAYSAMAIRISVVPRACCSIRPVMRGMPVPPVVKFPASRMGCPSPSKC